MDTKGNATIKLHVGETVRVHQKVRAKWSPPVHWDVTITEVNDFGLGGYYDSIVDGRDLGYWFFDENEIEILNGRVH